MSEDNQLIEISQGEAFADSIMTVKQLPVIEERLLSVKAYVDEAVKNALSLACTEETLADVKKSRADLNKMFQQLETGRKAVKAAVLAPYEQFESTYKTCVSDAFKNADGELRQKITETEQGIKSRCEEELRAYFAELCAAHHLDFISFEQTGVRVDMASAKAKTPKKLKEQLLFFVENVAHTVATIATVDNAEEVLAEYRQSLDFGRSIAVVQDRHRRAEDARKAMEALNEVKAQEAEIIKQVEAFAPPVPKETPQTVTVAFTVTDTVERLRMLKQFLIANNFKF